MAARARRMLLSLLSYLVPARLSRWLTRRACPALCAQLERGVTEGFLLLLLEGMDLMFCLSPRCRKNLRGFAGRYVFRTEDGRVVASAVFRRGAMTVERQPVEAWEARITFRTEAALWAVLLSNQGLFDAILADQVTVEGNLNYVYKLGFLAADLQHALGFA